MKIFSYREITSTNDYARELLQNEEIVCVTALNQTKGRGRNNNVWYGNFGNNLYISFGITHQTPCTLEKLSYFQSLGALAVKQTLQEITGTNSFKLKYPNDVYAADGNLYRKISGILIEHGFVGSDCIYSIVGIGINIRETKFEEEIREIATSLKLIGFDILVEDVQKLLIEKFSLLLELGENEIFEMWKSELNILGKEISIIENPNSNVHYESEKTAMNEKYIAKKVLSDGRLLVTNSEGKEIIIDNGSSIRYNLD